MLAYADLLRNSMIVIGRVWQVGFINITFPVENENQAIAWIDPVPIKVTGWVIPTELSTAAAAMGLV
jgi:hypothetical protein